VELIDGMQSLVDWYRTERRWASEIVTV
jgi:hypothetical protein